MSGFFGEYLIGVFSVGSRHAKRSTPVHVIIVGNVTSCGISAKKMIKHQARNTAKITCPACRVLMTALLEETYSGVP